MLTQIALQKLSALINQALATDPLALSELAKLHPKSFELRIDQTPVAIHVTFNERGVTLTSASQEHAATVSLSGTPSALLRFAKTDAHTQMLMDKKIKIHGDLDVLMTLKKIQAHAMIDWEGLLANYVGDFAANRFMLVAKSLKQKIAHHLGLVREDSLNYLHHEAGLLPAMQEAEDFYHEIRELRRDIDRLEIRVKRVANQRITN